MVDNRRTSSTKIYWTSKNRKMLCLDNFNPEGSGFELGPPWSMKEPSVEVT